MYLIEQFVNALEIQPIFPGYEIFLRDKPAGNHQNFVKKATGYLEIDGKPVLHYWDESGECRLYHKNGQRIPKYDLKFT